MRLRSHVALLRVLRRCPTSHALLPPFHLAHPRSQYSSSSTTYPERIAVLGGGVAGLSSAYFVAKEFPKSKITVFEAGEQTGGWIRSKHVEVPGGTITFESGPRTLRNAPVTASLIQELGLVKDTIFTFKDAPGALDRYVYYPDRLVHIPAKIPTLAKAYSLLSRGGLFGGVLNLVSEIVRPPRLHVLSDETIGSFVSRRIDKRVARNLSSAVAHGIYAGDIWQLSAKTLLEVPWQLEGRFGSVLWGLINLIAVEKGTKLVHPYDLERWRAINQEIKLEPEFIKNLANAATFTFRNGLQQLVHRLQESIEENENVKVQVDTWVQGVRLIRDGEDLQVAVTTAGMSSGSSKEISSTQNFDLVISTLREPELTPFVTVMTINLYYPPTPTFPEVPQGFGYLIPQSVLFEQNPERALGVIFDSSAVRGQDTAAGTKFTVMMGGHYWDGWEAYPDQEEGLQMAKNVLKRHLGISDEPAVWDVQLHRDCIPQYTIGYEDRLRGLAQAMRKGFQGRLRVVGSQHHGVGVNDCILAAWDVARGLRGDGWRTGTSGGLDRVMDRREWVTVKAREVSYTGAR